MRRPSSVIVVFLTFFTAAANLFENTGVTESMGIHTGVSAGQKLSQAISEMEQIRGSAGTVESLFSIFAMIGSAFEGFAAAVTAGPRLMLAAGLPDYIVAFLFAPAVLIVGLDIIYALSGRDL